MPKFAVGLMSAAIAGVIGFLLGALFTVPQNREMEELLNIKTELTANTVTMSYQIDSLLNENKKLVQSHDQLRNQNNDLRERLLKAYELVSD